MQLLDDLLRKLILGYVDHIVNSPEMIDRFDNIIDGNTTRGIDRPRFKDQARLILAELAALDVIGVIRHAHLQLVIQSAGDLRILFVPQSLQKQIVGFFGAKLRNGTGKIIGNPFQHMVGDLFAAGHLSHRLG